MSEEQKAAVEDLMKRNHEQTIVTLGNILRSHSRSILHEAATKAFNEDEYTWLESSLLLSQVGRLLISYGEPNKAGNGEEEVAIIQILGCLRSIAERAGVDMAKVLSTNGINLADGYHSDMLTASRRYAK